MVIRTHAKTKEVRGILLNLLLKYTLFVYRRRKQKKTAEQKTTDFMLGLGLGIPVVHKLSLLS